MDSIFRVGRYGLFYVSLMLFSVVSHAAVYDAYGVKSATIINGEFQTTYVVRETAATGVKTYRNASVAYPAARTSSLIKSALSTVKQRTPAALALAALMAASDWVIDELTGQVTAQGTPDETWISGKYWRYWAGNDYVNASTVQGVIDGYSALYPGFELRVKSVNSSGYYVVHTYYNGNVSDTSYKLISYQSCGSSPPSGSGCSLTEAPFLEGEPMTDAQLMEMLQKMSPGQLAELLTDQYGNPIMTPELIAKLKQLAGTDLDPENGNEVQEEQEEGQEEVNGDSNGEQA